MNICVLTELWLANCIWSCDCLLVPFIMVDAWHIYALIPTITVSGRYYYLFTNKEIKTQIYFPKAILVIVERGVDLSPGQFSSNTCMLYHIKVPSNFIMKIHTSVWDSLGKILLCKPARVGFPSHFLVTRYGSRSLSECVLESIFWFCPWLLSLVSAVYRLQFFLMCKCPWTPALFSSLVEETASMEMMESASLGLWWAHKPTSLVFCWPVTRP